MTPAEADAVRVLSRLELATFNERQFIGGLCKAPRPELDARQAGYLRRIAGKYGVALEPPPTSVLQGEGPIDAPSTAVALGREGWAGRITASWRKVAEGIIETGRLIAEAKAALPHGEFLAMVERDLPFGSRTAERLMKVASDPRLSNSTHASNLPSSWMTLYELTGLDDDSFDEAAESGVIHPDMTRAEAVALRRGVMPEAAAMQEAADRQALETRLTVDLSTLPAETQREIIARAAAPETIGALLRDHRAERQAEKKKRRETREAELGTRQRALPAKRYGVILADPEWRFEAWSAETGMDRAADNHYPTSALDDILARPVADIAAEDCALFLWATAPMLPEALRVMAAWGFTYKTHIVWLKDRIGTGYWFRNQHELLLFGTRGNVPAPAAGEQWRSALAFDVGGHSAKPDWQYELIEAYFPSLPKIELNARPPQSLSGQSPSTVSWPRDGWDVWGNEVPENSP